MCNIHHLERSVKFTYLRRKDDFKIGKQRIENIKFPDKLGHFWKVIEDWSKESTLRIRT